MFTGRVSIWQEIWEKFNSGTSVQRLFGAGLTSNAHSSYFFLLLEIGWLGLIYYIIFHGILLFAFLKRRIQAFSKILAIVSWSSILLIGFSATAVMNTSFQWISYMLIGSALIIERKDRKASKK
jgi:O-antigen ligase